MKIRLFVFSCVLYFVILAAFIFLVNSSVYTLSFLGFSYTMPVLMWVLLPALILFIFAFLHMSFYGFLRHVKYKNFFKDSAKFEDFACDILLEKDPRPNFKTSEFKRAAELCLAVKKLEKIHNLDKFNELIDLLVDIKDEKLVNLKKFRLSEDNKLFIQNEKNHIKSDLNYAYDRLRYKKELENELDELAFSRVLELASIEQIRALKLPKDKKFVELYINRLKEESFNPSLNEIEELLKSVELDEKDFLALAKSCINKFEPSTFVAFFKKLGEEKSEAKRAYYFILADLALFDELRLEMKDKKEFKDFELLLLARDKNIKIDLNDFIR